MMLSIFMEENHNSALYKNTLSIYILKSLILVLMFSFFEVTMLLYLLNATIARHFLLFMSVSVIGADFLKFSWVLEEFSEDLFFLGPSSVVRLFSHAEQTIIYV